MDKDKLVRQRAALIKQMEELTSGKEQLTDEERQKFDELEAQVKKVDDNIDKADKLAELKSKTPKPEDIPGPPAPDLTDGEKENLKKYSLRKALLQKAYPDEEGNLDGIELEMHQEAQKEARESGHPLSGLGLPSVQLRAGLQTGASAAGGYLVQTDVIDFITALRNNMPSIRAGARLMTGLNGDVSIPVLSTDATAAWRSEIGTAGQADPAFSAVTMTPHRLTDYTTYSRQLLLQTSYDVENIVRNSLTYAVANALETAGMEGDGNSQVPQGILNASVNDATHGSTNPTVASWANIVNMETMCAVDNAIGGRMAYIMKTTAAGKLKRTARDSVGGGYIWEGVNADGGANVNGYPVYVSNVFTDDTVIFGNWTELLYGQWGAIDLLVNPYSLDTKAQIRVVIAGYFDVAVAHAASFARIDDLVVT